MRRQGFGALAALMLALAAGGRASAASTVTIYPGIADASGAFPVYVVNSLGVPLGAVDVLVENATAFDLNTSLPGVSPPDSVYSVRPLDGVPWDALIVNNTALGVTLVPAGATVVLGTLVASVGPTLLPGETIYPPDGEPALGFSFFDANGTPIVGRIEPYDPFCDPGGCFGGHGFRLTVPELELSTAALLALAATALRIGRRRGRSEVS